MKNAGTLPIFDRLVDENTDVPFDDVPKRRISLEELKESIRKDLCLLMNTRVFPFWKDYVTEIPYLYGANITAPSSAETVFEIQELENRINRVIAQYEPRLKNVATHIISLGADPSTVFFQIDADVFINEARTPLTFPIVVDF